MSKPFKPKNTKDQEFDLENGCKLKIKFVPNSLGLVYSKLDMDLTFGKIPQYQVNVLNEAATSGKTETSYYVSEWRGGPNYDGTATDPGVISISTLDWVLTLPTEREEIEAFAAANQSVYNTIVGRAYTDSNFTVNDLTRLFIAESEIATLLEQAKRAIDIVGITSVVNEGLKQRLVYALGFDGDDMIDNYSNIVNAYNLTVRDFNKLTLPAGIPMLDKHIAMSANLYADDSHDKSQIFAFRHFFVYAEMAAVGNCGETGVIRSTNVESEILSGGLTSIPMLTFLKWIRRAIVTLYNSASYQSSFGPKLQVAYRLKKELGGMELGPIYQFDEISDLTVKKELTLIYDHAAFITLRNAVIYPLFRHDADPTHCIIDDTVGSERYYEPYIWTKTEYGLSYLTQGCHQSSANTLEDGLFLGNASATPALALQYPVTLATSRKGLFDSRIIDMGHYPYDNDTAALIFAEQHRFRQVGVSVNVSGTSFSQVVPVFCEASTEMFTKYHAYRTVITDSVPTHQHFYVNNSYSTTTNYAMYLSVMQLALRPRINGSHMGTVLWMPNDVDNPLRIPFTAMASARIGLWKYAFNLSLAGKGVDVSKPDKSE